MTAACPLVFLVLPASRKRAKVRWGHIVRVTCHGGVYMAAIAAVVLVWGTLSELYLSPSLYRTPQWADHTLLSIVDPLTVVYCAAIGIWWAIAIARYLRMDQALGVAVAVVVTALIASCAVMFVLYPSFIVMPLSRLLFPI